jgi:hypothetical protein
MDAVPIRRSIWHDEPQNRAASSTRGDASLFFSRTLAGDCDAGRSRILQTTAPRQQTYAWLNSCLKSGLSGMPTRRSTTDETGYARRFGEGLSICRPNGCPRSCGDGLGCVWRHSPSFFSGPRNHLECCPLVRISQRDRLAQDVIVVAIDRQQDIHRVLPRKYLARPIVGYRSGLSGAVSPGCCRS